MELVLVFIAALFGLFGAAIAAGKNRSPALGFVLGAFLSLLGLIIVVLLPAATPTTPQAMRASGMKKCPDCAEPIRAEARVCRYCRHEFSEESIEELRRAYVAASQPAPKTKSDAWKLSRQQRSMYKVAGLLAIPTLVFGIFIVIAAITR